MNEGYHVVAPWYVGFEIAAIWLGYFMMIGALLLVKFGKKSQCRN